MVVLPLSCLKCVNSEICPEMHANEIHELYYRHHKVSPTLNSSVKQVILPSMKSYENDKKVCLI